MRRWLLAMLVSAGPLAAGEDLLPPQPEIDIDRPEQYECREKELEYNPIASYRVSGLCEITDIQSVGDYQYGIRQVREDIRGFRSERTIKRFIRGQSRYRKQVRIKLHRALERASVLVCETDMLENRVYEAKIVRTREKEDGEEVKTEEPVAIDNQRLADLGIFTHSRRVTYTTDRCKE